MMFASSFEMEDAYIATQHIESPRKTKKKERDSVFSSIMCSFTDSTTCWISVRFVVKFIARTTLEKPEKPERVRMKGKKTKSRL